MHSLKKEFRERFVSKVEDGLPYLIDIVRSESLIGGGTFDDVGVSRNSNGLVLPPVFYKKEKG